FAPSLPPGLQSRRHPNPPRRIACDWLLDLSVIRLDDALHKRRIVLRYAPRCKLLRQIPMRDVILRNQQDTTSLPIEPMHNPRPYVPGRKSSESMKQSIDQST